MLTWTASLFRYSSSRRGADLNDFSVGRRDDQIVTCRRRSVRVAEEIQRRSRERARRPVMPYFTILTSTKNHARSVPMMTSATTVATTS